MDDRTAMYEVQNGTKVRFKDLQGRCEQRTVNIVYTKQIGTVWIYGCHVIQTADMMWPMLATQCHLWAMCPSCHANTARLPAATLDCLYFIVSISSLSPPLTALYCHVFVYWQSKWLMFFTVVHLDWLQSTTHLLCCLEELLNDVWPSRSQISAPLIGVFRICTLHIFT